MLCFYEVICLISMILVFLDWNTFFRYTGFISN